MTSLCDNNRHAASYALNNIGACVSGLTGTVKKCMLTPETKLNHQESLVCVLPAILNGWYSTGYLDCNGYLIL